MERDSHERTVRQGGKIQSLSAAAEQMFGLFALHPPACPPLTRTNTVLFHVFQMSLFILSFVHHSLSVSDPSAPFKYLHK